MIELLTMAGESKLGTPAKFNKYDIETLELLQKYLKACKDAGEIIGQPYALPNELDRTAYEDLSERLITDGLPGPDVEEEPAADNLPKISEPATKEQLIEIFKAMNELITQAYFSPLAGLFKRNQREGIVLLPNLPGKKRWSKQLSSEAKIKSEGKTGSPNAIELDLSSFTNPTGSVGQPIIRVDDPLGMADRVKLSFDQKGNILAGVKYNVIPKDGDGKFEKIFSKKKTSTSGSMYFLMNNLEAEQLLQILQRPPAK